MLNHTALLNKRKVELGTQPRYGFDVNIEGQNSFQLRGRSATLAGQPDLITQRDGQAVIVDVKTGQDSASHVVQVMIYLYAIPRALEQLPDSQTQRAGHLLGPHGPHTGGGCGRPVHTEPGSIDPQTVGRQAARPSAEQTGMSLLRHQRPRLSGAYGRRLRTRRRNYQRLLNPPPGVVASSRDW